MTERATIKAHCNECGHETKHLILNTRTTEGSQEFEEGYIGEAWADTYEMLECCGCESVVLRHSNFYAPSQETTVKHYPPRVSRPSPRWKYQLPHELRYLLEEIYNTLYSDGRRLAIMGARTVVDLVMYEKVGEDKGTFEKNLKALEDLGLIGRKNREFLAAAIDSGSAAAHRGYVPSPEEVNHVMDIVENLLEAVYVLDKAAERLKKSNSAKKALAEFTGANVKCELAIGETFSIHQPIPTQLYPILSQSH